MDIIKCGFLLMWSAALMLFLGVLGLWIGLVRLGHQLDQHRLQLEHEAGISGRLGDKVEQLERVDAKRLLDKE